MRAKNLQQWPILEQDMRKYLARLIRSNNQHLDQIQLNEVDQSNIGESSEQLYAASISDTHSSRYSASHGQRNWNAFGDFNTAWSIGRADGVGFASFQLERDINQS